MNFIDTTVKNPPITPPTQEWDVVFQDESRDIASEYRGGLGRYIELAADAVDVLPKEEPSYDFPSTMIDTPVLTHQQLPSQSFPAGGVEVYPGSLQGMPDQGEDTHQRHASTNSDSTFSSHTLGGVSSYTSGDQTLTSASESREILTDPQELLFMQVFVEEVGIWMDSMDPYKHVRPIPSVRQLFLNSFDINSFPACCRSIL